MKSGTKIIILIIFGNVFALSTLTISILLSDNGELSKRSKSIEISGNLGWSNAKAAGIVTGSGTYSDPYLIEDLILLGSEDYNYNGISIKNSNVHFKIENCTIHNYYSGVTLNNVSNAKLINNNCSFNNKGIVLYKSYNNIISGNIVNNNIYEFYIWGSGPYYYGFGIFLGDGGSNTITGNIANNNGEGGIILENINNSIITGNTLNNNHEDGINLKWCHNNSLSGNLMNECGLNLEYWYEDSIEVLGSNDIDTTNLVNGKPLYYYSNEKNLGPNNFTNGGQVLLVNCSDSFISNLNVSYGSMGISVCFSNNINITGNTANYNNYEGITIKDSNNITISGNTANYNEHGGIYLENNINSIISGNTVNNNNWDGIYLSGDDNVLSGNSANTNGYIGISLDGDDNVLSGNTVNNNDGSGIHFEGYNFTISGNIMNECGLTIEYYYEYSIEVLGSHDIDTTNLVNGKPLYYYTNEKNLGPNNFTNAGQVFLVNCSDSFISNLNVSYSGTGISLYFSDHNTISGNTANNNNNGIELWESQNNNIIGNIIHNSTNTGIAITGRSGKNTISGNIIRGTRNDSDSAIEISGDYNTVSGNNVSNNGYGMYIYGDYNTVSGNNVSNNEYGIYLVFFCNEYHDSSNTLVHNNVISDNFFQNNNYDYVEEGSNCGHEEEPTLFPEYLFSNIYFLLGIFYVPPLIYLGIISIILIIRSKILIKGKKELSSKFKFKVKPTNIKSKTEIKTKPINAKREKVLNNNALQIKSETLDVNQEKILQGKTLQVYWYILTHNGAGVREIQKSLNISSPGTVSYQINKLVKAGIISKDDKDGKYYVNEGIKKGILGFYIRIGYFMIPRFSLYLIINILGFVGYIIFASIYGDKFITNPGSILLLVFLIFGTAVFIFESIKIWKRKPTKLN